MTSDTKLGLIKLTMIILAGCAALYIGMAGIEATYNDTRLEAIKWALRQPEADKLRATQTAYDMTMPPPADIGDMAHLWEE